MVSVLDVATNTVIAKVRVGARPYGVAISPDNSKVYVTNNADNTVSIIDAVTNTVTGTFPVGADPRGIAVSLDGNKVYVACFEGEIDVHYIDRNLTIAVPMPLAAHPVGLAISTDGELLYIVSENTASFPLNTTNNTTNHTNHILPGIDIRINSHANKIYEASPGSIDVSFGNDTTTYHPNGFNYDLTTKKEWLFITPEGEPTRLTTSPDGSLVYLTIPEANKVALVNAAITVLDNTATYHIQEV